MGYYWGGFSNIILKITFGRNEVVPIDIYWEFLEDIFD